jgi:hypothetical protein
MVLKTLHPIRVPSAIEKIAPTVTARVVMSAVPPVAASLSLDPPIGCRCEVEFDCVP